ncbi:MAG: sulfur carrier protein ThiS [Planctomycetota bacterium]
MRCTVNGEIQELPDDLTVGGLIDRLGLTGSICAAEIDRELVPKSQRDVRVLRDGESVEIVTLVGGG